MDIRKAALTAVCLLATPASADPISGYVSANGVPLVASSRYFVIHRGIGHYDIQFTTPMEPSASCVITPVLKPKLASKAPYVRKLAESSTHCLFNLLTSGGGHSDSDFSFIATPMSN